MLGVYTIWGFFAKHIVQIAALGTVCAYISVNPRVRGLKWREDLLCYYVCITGSFSGHSSDHGSRTRLERSDLLPSPHD